MAQSRLITDLVELVNPSNGDLLVIVDNTTDPTLSTTKKITYANLVEDLQDMVDLLIVEGTGVVATYSDVGNTITLSVSGDTTTQKSIYSSGGTAIGTRQQLNFIPGAGVTLTGADNPNNNRVDLTVNTTNVSSGTNLTATGQTADVLATIGTLGNGTKDLRFRTIKAGSDRISVVSGDAGNSILVDIVPSGIDINTLNVNSPLAIALGGTNATSASAARASLGSAKSGVNSDITSLTGLTTPLSVAQGGTSANTSQAGLRNLQGLNNVTDVSTAGESLVVNASTLVSNNYRAELKGIKASSSKVTVATIANDIGIDVDAQQVLNGATNDIDFNGYKLTNVANPIASTDVATKAYTDSVAQGLTVKEAVLIATTSGLVGTYAISGQTFTLTASGTPTVDGLSITASGTRVLFKNQATQSQNGIYALTTSGQPSVQAIFTRALDSNDSTEVKGGSFCFVLSGTTNANKQFVQTVQAPTLDSSALVYTVLADTILPAGSVDNTKLANMDALHVKGAISSGVPQDLNANELIAIVNTSSDAIDAGTY